MNPSPIGAGGATRHPLFLRSSKPMLVSDDTRRFVGANTAACLFLRMSHETILGSRLDDLTPSEARSDMEARWAMFLRTGMQTGSLELAMPDGTRVAVDYSATANVRPGRHLSVLAFPVAGTLNEALRTVDPPISTGLSQREREVLSLVALGYTGVRIASRLHLSPATVQTHVRNALTKLRARNRAHGIAIALQSGQLDLRVPEPASEDEPAFGRTWSAMESPTLTPSQIPAPRSARWAP